MKNYLVSLILFFLGNICLAQQYQPFPTNNARWIMHSDFNAPFIPNGYCDEYQIDITGDTTINTVNYHKLQISVVEYWWYAGAGCTNIFKNYTTHYFGSFREDILNKKVFFLTANSTNEKLLYDFNLELGDTLPWLLINNDTSVINWVSGIDSVLLEGVYHKCFKISADTSSLLIPQIFTFNYVTLIEGIGSTFGLTAYLFPHWWFEADGYDQLVCMSVGGTIVYPDGALLCNPVGIRDNLPEEKSFEIFPNPAYNRITINLITHISDAPLFSLFNSMGQIVLMKRLEVQQSEIDIQSLPCGVYSYQLIGIQSKNSGKLVKIK
ncbi:MAG: T9SS type A sorting domain-containing protein [Bacteroidetes bacterium]|nr:T9SS type A sorting domain-containing protein [Bacteroidota bacterium]